MNKLSLLLLSLFIVGLMSTSILFGQTTGDFRSAQTGNWGDLTTWQSYNGSSWVAATTTPDSTIAAAVTILSGHNVTVAATVTVRNVTVNSGATVTLAGSSAILYIAQEGMTVNGTLVFSGTVPTAAPFTVTAYTGTLTIGNGAVVNYNQTGTTKGALPTATWLTGSTLNVNAIGATSSTGWNAGGNQNFYNIIWNVPTLAANFGWGFTSATIGGTVTVLNTLANRLQFFGGSSGTLNIMGDLIVSGSASATIMGSSSSTNDTINIYGKLNVNTTGNFSISRGSGSGTCVFNFYGDSVKIIAATMGNSNGSTDGAKFIFKKNGTQYFTATPTTATGNFMPVEAGTGSIVTLLSPVNVTSLYLNGGVIVSSTSNPLIMGWWSGSAVTSGSVSATAPGSSTSYVSGPMSFLYATAGSTSKTFPLGKGGIYRPLTLSLTQSATTLSTYTAEIFNSAPPANSLPGTLDKVSAVRYYKISETSGGSAFTAGSVLLNYGAEDGVSAAANLRIAQGPVAGGGTWVDLAGTGTASTTGTITSTVNFSDLITNTIFTLADNVGGGNVLPVELTSFTASTNSNSVILSWSTSTESLNSGWNIERSKDNNWEKVGFVNGNGNSNSVRSYSFTDKKTLTGKYFYRLKQIDFNGVSKYSKSVEVNIAIPTVYSVQNYPNPFNPSTIVRFALPVSGMVNLSVYNILGEKIVTLVNEKMEQGVYERSFNGSNLATGIYIYKLTADNFTLSKKMILIK